MSHGKQFVEEAADTLGSAVKHATLATADAAAGIATAGVHVLAAAGSCAAAAAPHVTEASLATGRFFAHRVAPPAKEAAQAVFEGAVSYACKANRRFKDSTRQPPAEQPKQEDTRAATVKFTEEDDGVCTVDYNIGLKTAALQKQRNEEARQGSRPPSPGPR